jgi:hypothetical protein
LNPGEEDNIRSSAVLRYALKRSYHPTRPGIDRGWEGNFDKPLEKEWITVTREIKKYGEGEEASTLEVITAFKIVKGQELQAHLRQLYDDIVYEKERVAAEDSE